MTIDQLTFPAEARETDPGTSKAAARAMQPEALRTRLLRTYNTRLAGFKGGLTDDEAGYQANVRSGWWKRCSDLRKAGLIVDTGLRRSSDSGHPQMVCAITDEGRAALL